MEYLGALILGLVWDTTNSGLTVPCQCQQEDPRASGVLHTDLPTPAVSLIARMKMTNGSQQRPIRARAPLGAARDKGVKGIAGTVHRRQFPPTQAVAVLGGVAAVANTPEGKQW